MAEMAEILSACTAIESSNTYADSTNLADIIGLPMIYFCHLAFPEGADFQFCHFCGTHKIYGH